MLTFAKMAEGGDQDPVIIEDDPGEEWQDIGPQNPAEAWTYRDKVDAVFDGFSQMLNDDQKDALLKPVQNFKRVAAHHWWQMADADVDIAMKTIQETSCLHLCQSLVTGTPEVVEQSTEVPSRWEFLHSLPEWKRKEEEQQMIITLFDHVSKAHAHASSTAACVSSLGKITNPQTFNTVLRVVAHPMVQINLVQDLKLTTTAEVQQEKIGKMLLPQSNAACLAHGV